MLTFRLLAVTAVLALAGSACAAAGDPATPAATTPRAQATTPDAPAPSASPSVPPSPSPSPTPPSPIDIPEANPSASPSPPSGDRVVREQAYTPFAVVGPVTLLHPSRWVERIGFHQSNHDGALQLQPLDSASNPLTMQDRERDTARRGAADIVVDPAAEIRSPVSGTVKRGGTYVLYCEHSDDFVVIEPDDRPGWEVKLLHIDGLRVGVGDRVEAGVTVLAGGPTPLPFRSQVDDHTAEPSWPHVHLEVVDPSIPDRTSPGGGCS